jgi:hypothetical protein
VPRTVAPCEPTAAEQVRSILATAGSAAVTANGAHEDFMAGVVAEFGEALRLRVPADSHTAAEAACGPAVGVPAALEWTDLAPVPVRDRVRAQVRIVGRLHAPEPAMQAGAVRLRVDVRGVALDAGGTRRLVAPADLLAARPDPMATAEARLLLHLAEEHREHVEALARLLTVRRLIDVTRVTPLALDRYGIVLRLHRPDGHSDARLPFARPLADPDELGHHIHDLLARAHHRHHRSA